MTTLLASLGSERLKFKKIQEQTRFKTKSRADICCGRALKILTRLFCDGVRLEIRLNIWLERRFETQDSAR